MKKSSSRTVDGHRLIALLFLLAGCLIVSATLPASDRPEAAPKVSNRALTFAERVAYQYAIEEVYWRHRIWPKENATPKPSLDEVMSAAQIEKKVEDYLRDSQLLADQWQRPITRDQLQTEMERMVSHTKQPDVLGELLAALGNDPFVIAECLARPILAERLTAQLLNDSASESSRAKSRNPVERPLSGSAGFESLASLAARAALQLDFARNDIVENAAYELPETSNTCADDTWAATTTVNAPDAREFHTAVWTGSEMIIWGGFGNSDVLDTGARYNPATDSWIATNVISNPGARGLHSAVWTGTEMVVWGGGGHGLLNTGGRYNPTADSWMPTSMTNVPAARNYHTAVWTGSEMIVWGGNGCGGNCQWNTGGRYNPTADSWTATSTTNAPVARFTHIALWTGSEMIIWGGSDGIVNHTYLHTGGRYNPVANSWTPTGLTNVPLGRDGFTGIWSGSEMIVWGGVDENFNVTNTGGRYNPDTDSWVATSVVNAPSPRADHTAVWSGSEMIVWAGDDTTGGRYNRNTDSWTPTTTANAPSARDYPTAVWTGSQMIVWGGINDITGGVYCARPSAPLLQSAASRKTHGFAGTFDIALPLNGTPGIECRTGGATNDYTVALTFSANVSVDGNPQAAVTSGVGTIGTGGVSNGGMIITSGNVVTIPLTNVANAQTINVTLNNVNGSTNVTIPMSILIADVNGNGAVNASDVSVTKSRIGQTVTQTNFRSDVNAGGSINATDVSAIKARVGTGLP